MPFTLVQPANKPHPQMTRSAPPSPSGTDTDTDTDTRSTTIRYMEILLALLT